MENSTLRQIIRESIQSYIHEIDHVAEVAATEARIRKMEEAIEERKSMINMEGIEETMHKMIDKKKIKEIEKEIKHLERSLAKYKKQLEKMKSKDDKKSKETKPEEDKEMVDEMTSEVQNVMDENYMEEENSLNEEMIGGVNYDSTIAVELKAKVGDLSKLTPYVLEKGNNVQSDSSGKIYVTDSETKKKTIYKDIDDFLRGIGYQIKMNESFLYMQKLAGVITEAQYKAKIK
jgi:vacuolar-type H+-ATPase subunit I/STV1